MKNKKKLAKFAKIMFKNSKTEGYIDSNKVNLILKEITSKKIPGLSKILKIYKQLIEKALSFEEIVIESAIPSTYPKTITDTIISKTGAKRIKYITNPKIIIGAKITHGDWVYDQTLQAKLNQLTINY